MIWADAAVRRFRQRQAARLEVWAAREHARIAGMSREARAAFAEPRASVVDFAHEEAMRNGSGYVTPELWAEAQRRYLDGGAFAGTFFGSALLPDGDMFQLRENGSVYDFSGGPGR